MAGILGGNAPTPPPIKPPAPMPDPMSPAVMEANRKATADLFTRAGRSSTILSARNAGGGAAAAGTPYAAKTLGGGG